MIRLHLTIRLKVLLALGVLTAVAMALGVFALDRLASVNAAAAELRGKWLPSTQIVARMSLAFEQYRIAEGRALVAVSAEAAQAVADDLRVRSQEVQRQRAAYSLLARSDEEQRIARDFDRYWDSYLTISSEMMALVRQGARDQAALIYNGKARTPVANARKSATELLDLNMREGAAAAARADAIYVSTRVWIMGALVVAVLISCIAVFAIIRGVSMPLRAMTTAMQRLAEGDEETAIAGTGRHDEIGCMASALEVFRSNIIDNRQLAKAREEDRQRADAAHRAALIDMAAKIESEAGLAFDQIGSRTMAMAATADEMHVSSARTGDLARDASTAAQQVLANAQTVASSSEQLSGSIREIAAQVSQSTTVVASAVESASETRGVMKALNDRVSQIGAVADMIGEIASKTNLLALNATIEAARAGDAGKGFAVVASEVKALATQTAASTQEIARHISEVRAATSASVDAVSRIEQTIGQVNAIAGSIAAAVKEQGAATSEIARNVTETASAANQMTGQIGDVSAEAERTDHQAGEVHNNASGLNAAVDGLKRSLVQIVRTSTADVDRRMSVRQELDLPCRVTVAGNTLSGRVVNLSEGGSCVAGVPGLQIGAAGQLNLAGIGYPLPFIVQEEVDGVCRVAFRLDAETEAKFRSVPESLIRCNAA